MAGEKLAIRTADGTADAWLFRAPGGKRAPGVIYYCDALGMRAPALDMAERLSESGYTVLAPDLFYRSAPYQPFDGMTLFSSDSERARLMAMIGATPHELTRRDSEVFLDLMATEAPGPVGLVGYCFGGGRAMTAAGSYPARVSAIAAFHATRIATEEADSPHRVLPNMKARLYFGVAGIDPGFPPEEEGRLASTLRAADIDHTIETYRGVRHGFAVGGMSVYDHDAAERHWSRLLTFFSETLQPGVTRQ